MKMKKILKVKLKMQHSTNRISKQFIIWVLSWMILQTVSRCCTKVGEAAESTHCLENAE